MDVFIKFRKLSSTPALAGYYFLIRKEFNNVKCLTDVLLLRPVAYTDCLALTQAFYHLYLWNKFYLITYFYVIEFHLLIFC